MNKQTEEIMITKVIPTAITNAATKVSECCAFITQTSMKSVHTYSYNAPQVTQP